MELVFSAILSQFKIDEKGGGYLLTLSIPESDKEELGQLVMAGKQIFKCVLIADAAVPCETSYNEE